jgi:hypothetical protein
MFPELVLLSVLVVLKLTKIVMISEISVFHKFIYPFSEKFKLEYFEKWIDNYDHSYNQKY